MSEPIVALFMLGEPVGATILAWLIFGEVPGRWTLVGGAIVLVMLGGLARRALAFDRLLRAGLVLGVVFGRRPGWATMPPSTS